MAEEKLTDVVLRNAKPSEKARKLFDGGGLYLEVQPSGAKYWRLKYRIAGVEKRLSLGVYPEIGLKDARRKSIDARKLVAEGRDPSDARREAKAEAVRAHEAKRLSAAGLPSKGSFEAVARDWLRTVHEVTLGRRRFE